MMPPALLGCVFVVLFSSAVAARAVLLQASTLRHCRDA